MVMSWTLRGQFLFLAWLGFSLLLARLGLGAWGAAVACVSGLGSVLVYPNARLGVFLGWAGGFLVGVSCVAVYYAWPHLAPPILPQYPGGYECSLIVMLAASPFLGALLAWFARVLRARTSGTP